MVERALDVDERYMKRALDPLLSPAAQLRAVADAALAFATEHPGHFRLIAFPHEDAPSLTDTPRLSPEARRVAERVEQQVILIAEALKGGLSAGLIRPVDPTRVARFLWGAWNGVIAFNTRPDRLRLDSEELAAVLDEGIQLVARGLQAPGTEIMDVLGD